MKSTKQISLQCLYCDDIRDEKEGKTTIVGWYGGEHIKLPAEGPLILPSLGVIGLVAVPSESNYKTFKLDLMLDDAILHSANVPPQIVGNLQKTADSASRGKEIRIALKVANMQISDPGVLRLRVVVDEEEIYGNGIRFSRDTPIQNEVK